MFGFGGLKKADPSTPGGRHLLAGVDLSASRLRAVAAGQGGVRPLALDDPHDDLPLFVTLDARPPLVGHAAVARLRLAPHSVCGGFLPLAGTPNEWRGERLTLTPDAALGHCLRAARPALDAETDAVGVVLPAYLGVKAVRAVAEAAAAAGWAVRGTASLPLAVVGHRATGVPAGVKGADPAVLVIDADEHAVSAAVVAVGTDEATVLAHTAVPKAGVRAWKDRLIDALADRCVRVCRRDPRDSAAAEQDLFLQLDDALDAARTGRRVTLGVRGEKWYQDLTVGPDEFEAMCDGVNKLAVDGLREMLQAAPLPVPPRAVWLTHAAGRLPGLAAKLHKHSPADTRVSLLPPNAAAEAAAALVPRWLTGHLPRGHLDQTLPHARPLAGVRPPKALPG